MLHTRIYKICRIRPKHLDILCEQWINVAKRYCSKDQAHSFHMLISCSRVAGSKQPGFWINLYHDLSPFSFEDFKSSRALAADAAASGRQDHTACNLCTINPSSTTNRRSRLRRWIRRLTLHWKCATKILQNQIRSQLYYASKPKLQTRMRPGENKLGTLIGTFSICAFALPVVHGSSGFATTILFLELLKPRRVILAQWSCYS